MNTEELNSNYRKNLEQWIKETQDVSELNRKRWDYFGGPAEYYHCDDYDILDMWDEIVGFGLNIGITGPISADASRRRVRIKYALRKFEGRKQQAEFVGVNERTLFRSIKELKLDVFEKEIIKWQKEQELNDIVDYEQQ